MDRRGGVRPGASDRARVAIGGSRWRTPTSTSAWAQVGRRVARQRPVVDDGRIIERLMPLPAKDNRFAADVAAYGGEVRGSTSK
jgi:hypothetical protein